MWNEVTTKCLICGDPYKIWIHYAGDQSACPKCQSKAKQNDSKRYIDRR